MIKLILTEDVKSLGEIGDLITVQDGYARNFLIPQRKAKEATPSNIKSIEQEKKKLMRIKEKETQEAQELATKIEAISCTISVRVGEDEKLFGSVTSDAIAKACAAEGIEIDKHKIVLDQPVKELGVFQIPVKLKGGVVASLKVWIVKE